MRLPRVARSRGGMLVPHSLVQSHDRRVFALLTNLECTLKFHLYFLLYIMMECCIADKIMMIFKKLNMSVRGRNLQKPMVLEPHLYIGVFQSWKFPDTLTPNCKFSNQQALWWELWELKSSHLEFPKVRKHCCTIEHIVSSNKELKSLNIEILPNK